MKNYRSRIVCITVAVLLALSIPVAVFAVNNAITPQSKSGSFEHKIINRVNFGIENTDFVFKKQSQGKETYTLSFTFTAQKTEADFYAIINSFSVTGINPNYILYTSDEGNNGVYVLNSVVLTADNGEPNVFKWTAEINFDAETTAVITPEIVINYSSGMTKESASTYSISIPLKVTIE